jgi:hypothetical protein
MKTSKIKAVSVAVALLAFVAVIVWQQRRNRHVMADADALRQQVEQVALLRDENQRLAEQLRLASERSRADASELARLRGQAARTRQVEQESRLKAERERPAKPPAPNVPDEQTPEWKLAQVQMRFSKVLGLSILSFANDHARQMPTNLLNAILSQTEKQFAETLADQLPPEAAQHEIRLDQFELVFQGNLEETGRAPGATVIARAKEPVQLSNGRWARPAVFDDGHAEIFVADTREELAAKEKPWMQAQIAQ